MIAHLRFFAAAAEAAGTDSATIELAAGSALADLVALIGDALRPADPERLARVLSLCSFLVEGKHASLEQALPTDPRVDVLPPFAGG